MVDFDLDAEIVGKAPAQSRPPFQVAIPSRGRVRALYLQSYRKIIFRHALEDVTTIFVQTPEDLQSYTAAFPRVQVVLNQGEGLACQQRAIQRHYPVGTRVVILHDDVTRVVSLRGGRTRRFEDVQRLFEASFLVMEAFGVSLGGLAPTDNPLYAENSKKVSLGLKFIYDPLHFEIVQPLDLTYCTEMKHDVERSIQHYSSCGGILRLADFSAATRHCIPHGKREQDRADTEMLLQTYGKYIASARARRGGYAAIQLKPMPYVGRECAMNGQTTEACERVAEELFTRSLGNFDVLPDVRLPGGRLLQLLQTRKWSINDLRTAVVPPDRRVLSWSCRSKKEVLRADAPLFTESFYEGPVFDASLAVLPAGLRFDFVTINRNLCCYPHRDAGNVGKSLILFLGDYEGGDLLLETGERFTERGVLHAFDGSLLHWNEPITGGVKYSVVFYNRQSGALRGNSLSVGSMHDSQDVERYHGFRVPFV